MVVKARLAKGPAWDCGPGWLEGWRRGVHCSWPCERGLLFAVAILEFWVLLRCLPLLRWVGSLVLILSSFSIALRAVANVAKAKTTLGEHDPSFQNLTFATHIGKKQNRTKTLLVPRAPEHHILAILRRQT